MILGLIDDAVQAGLPRRRACRAAGLCLRRERRWRRHRAAYGLQRQPRPGPPPVPAHALLPAERAAVEGALATPAWVDHSCRDLAMDLYETAGFYVSHVSIWRRQVTRQLNGPRGVQRQRRVRPHDPLPRPNAPNQCWAWDISYLKTFEPWRFLYLYALLDTFSRHVVAWLITERLSSELAQTLWDEGLTRQGLWASPPPQLPRSLSDNGPQMRSHSTARFFHRLGIHPTFARPATPNDNPHIEAFFSTAKNVPGYPGRFVEVGQARGYFTRFFQWYHHEHRHTALQMLTPFQVHSGQGPRLLAERAEVRQRTLAARLAADRRAEPRDSRLCVTAEGLGASRNASEVGGCYLGIPPKPVLEPPRGTERRWLSRSLSIS